MTSSHTRTRAYPFEVTFTNVGRNKRGWSSILNQRPTEIILERMVRKHGGLMSSDIECVFAEDGWSGTIVVGGMRPVGEFRVTYQTDEERTHG